MATPKSKPALLIVAAVLACLSGTASAQDNMNTTIQVGKVNINRTFQCGENNANATYQDGQVNINKTIQRCPNQRSQVGQVGRMNPNRRDPDKGRRSFPVHAWQR